jgi:hypothetical protein
MHILFRVAYHSVTPHANQTEKYTLVLHNCKLDEVYTITSSR